MPKHNKGNLFVTFFAIPACRQASLPRDPPAGGLKYRDWCPVLLSGNTPSRQAGSFAETAQRAVSIRSALLPGRQTV